MRRFIWIAAAALTASCRSAAPEAPAPGRLDPERLTRAAEAAGFTVRQIDARLPAAAPSRLSLVGMAWDDPRLVALRKKYPVEQIVAGAGDSWTAQLRLKEWVHRAIPDGTPKTSPHHAVEILDAAARGETFWCTFYSITYLECALALGWPCRKVAIDRRHGPEGLGSVHHGIVEVWSDRFSKWAAIDAQSNLHFEKRGTPLSAWEIRAEWLRNQGADVERVVGAPSAPERRKTGIKWWTNPDEDETAAFFWIYVIDHADISSSEARYFLPQDGAHAGQTWYQNHHASGTGRPHIGYDRKLFRPTTPDDLYWTEGVVEAALSGVEAGRIHLALDSSGVGLDGFQVSVDGREWTRTPSMLTWPLHEGRNELRLRSVRRGGTFGPESSVALSLDRR